MARWGRGLLAGLALAGLAGAARAEDGVLGTWSGHYACAQGETGLTLTVQQATGDAVGAVFHFHALPGTRVPEGCFRMSGRYDAAHRQLRLTAGGWLLQPPDYVTVDLSGTIDAEGRGFSGTVLGPSCTTFELRRTSLRLTDPAPACQGGATVADAR